MQANTVMPGFKRSTGSRQGVVFWRWSRRSLLVHAPFGSFAVASEAPVRSSQGPPLLARGVGCCAATGCCHAESPDAMGYKLDLCVERSHIEPPADREEVAKQ